MKRVRSDTLDLRCVALARHSTVREFPAYRHQINRDLHIGFTLGSEAIHTHGLMTRARVGTPIASGTRTPTYACKNSCAYGTLTFAHTCMYRCTTLRPSPKWPSARVPACPRGCSNPSASTSKGMMHIKLIHFRLLTLLEYYTDTIHNYNHLSLYFLYLIILCIVLSDVIPIVTVRLSPRRSSLLFQHHETSCLLIQH